MPALPHPFLLAALALAALQWLTTAALAQPAPPERVSAQAPVNMAYAHEMKGRMLMGMDGMQKLQLTGNVDKDFALMMKVHHQQSVHLAEMLITNGRSPAMRSMARQIRAVQKSEIAKFDGWLAQQP